MANKNKDVKRTQCNHLDSTGLAPKTAATSNNTVLDPFNFDETATQMAALKALIFDSPETSQAKIEFIKEELAAGRYEIHSSRIAAKLLEFMPMTEETEIEIEIA